MRRTSDLSIIICGIVRNAEKGLRRNIPVLKKVCAAFREYNIFVYENDSVDKTKQLLQEWEKSDPSHVFISLNNSDSSKTIPSQKETGQVNPFFSQKRIQKMAMLRNRYMDFIEKNDWVADYLMVLDLDVARISLDGVLNSFHSGVVWDAVTAFGYSLSPNLKWRYHDTYALTEYGNEDKPQTLEIIKSKANELGKKRRTDEWIRVYSAFGGLAIYRFDAVKELKYQVIPNNDNYVEVRCEHFSLCKQMAERGFDKVYINPHMELKYQSLSIGVIYNYIVRFFSPKTSAII